MRWLIFCSIFIRSFLMFSSFSNEGERGDTEKDRSQGGRKHWCMQACVLSCAGTWVHVCGGMHAKSYRVEIDLSAPFKSLVIRKLCPIPQVGERVSNLYGRETRAVNPLFALTWKQWEALPGWHKVGIASTHQCYYDYLSSPQPSAVNSWMREGRENSDTVN